MGSKREGEELPYATLPRQHFPPPYCTKHIGERESDCFLESYTRGAQNATVRRLNVGKKKERENIEIRQKAASMFVLCVLEPTLVRVAMSTAATQ